MLLSLLDVQARIYCPNAMCGTVLGLLEIHLWVLPPTNDGLSILKKEDTSTVLRVYNMTLF